MLYNLLQFKVAGFEKPIFSNVRWCTLSNRKLYVQSLLRSYFDVLKSQLISIEKDDDDFQVQASSKVEKYQVI